MKRCKKCLANNLGRFCWNCGADTKEAQNDDKKENSNIDNPGEPNNANRDIPGEVLDLQDD